MKIPVHPAMSAQALEHFASTHRAEIEIDFARERIYARMPDARLFTCGRCPWQGGSPRLLHTTDFFDPPWGESAVCPDCGSPVLSLPPQAEA